MAISVVRARSNLEGSCQGCTAHATSAGIAPHTVLCIRLGATLVRVCESCATELRGLLR